MRRSASGAVDRHRFAAPDGDGLEVLRTHDGACPGAPCLPATVVADAGEAHEVFAGRTYACDAHPCAEHVLDGGLRVGCAQAGEAGGVFEADAVLVDDEQSWAGCAAQNDDGVAAGLLEFGGEETGREGVANEAGHWRLGGNGELA